MDIIISNNVQVTRLTTELIPHSPHHANGRTLSLDRFNVHQFVYKAVFSDTRTRTCVLTTPATSLRP
ncbi:hypothetical protein TNCV_647761 [Trichonephila clavipes]|uniref:Uncharacterized protein n=1 Tax=Trichonephila clavipes TaxID=2585209 RepID=A0A8X6SJ79_TRICX|nr:hypothetical protein TNCV_647761 [Trichonephila clavipes]